MRSTRHGGAPAAANFRFDAESSAIAWGNAHALLFPVRWPEPFTVETMARAYIDVYSSLIESHRLGRAS